MTESARPVPRLALLVLGTFAGAAAVFFGGRAGYDWARTSERFALRTLSFHGLERATQAELTHLSGLAPGQNLFGIDPSAVARAMAQDPWIKRVDVSRRFPSSIFVVATEREPVAMASLGDLYLLDEDGQPFKRVQPGDPVDVPLVSGVSRDEYVASPAAATARFRKALAVLSAYEQSDRPAGAKLSEIRLELDGVTLINGSGQEIHLADAPTGEQLARLARIAAELSRRGLTAEVIRLDNRLRPGWVTVKVSTPVSERRGAK